MICFQFLLNSSLQIQSLLYPNDNGPSGKALPLKPQYFFSSASLQDLVRHYVADHGTDFSKFSDLHVIQLNDTHPVVAIPELMRILIDEYNVGWDEAWDVVTKTFAYTNHTILAEALEKWPIDIFQGLLPRIYQIVEEINRRLIIELREKFPNDYEKQQHMSIIHNDKVYMAWLAIHSCFSVNGVAAIHTDILKNTELNAFYKIYPEKFLLFLVINHDVEKFLIMTQLKIKIVLKLMVLFYLGQIQQLLTTVSFYIVKMIQIQVLRDGLIKVV